MANQQTCQATSPEASQEARLSELAIPLTRGEKWSPGVLAKLTLYFCVCLVGLTLMPNHIWDHDSRTLIYAMGVIGVWRFGWWFNHWIRALVYEHVAYPRIRARADAI